jgi:hypothetical protein
MPWPLRLTPPARAFIAEKKQDAAKVKKANHINAVVAWDSRQRLGLLSDPLVMALVLT